MLLFILTAATLNHARVYIHLYCYLFILVYCIISIQTFYWIKIFVAILVQYVLLRRVLHINMLLSYLSTLLIDRTLYII